MLLAVPVHGDDVGVTSARLIELEDGYAIEADISPAMVPLLGAPVVPERFSARGKPSYRQVGVVLVVRYEFAGSDVPLQDGDTILLPWGRSAVLLTARWQDGEAHRAMFPRMITGIPIDIGVLRPREHTVMSVMRAALGRSVTVSDLLGYVLLAIAIVLAVSGKQGIRLALVFALGHGVAMVARDLGAPVIPPPFARGAIALGVVVVARGAMRKDAVPLWPLVAVLGLINGLGLSGWFGQDIAGLNAPAFFAAALAACGVVMILMVVFSAGRGLFRGRFADATLVAVGSVALAVTVWSVTGAQSTARVGGDPADRMTAARLDAGPTGGVGKPVSGQSFAPRSLEHPALVFVSIEPREIRVEVLLSLQHFLEPLRIEGGPGSVVPVEVQEAIASRALEWVGNTLDVTIDGRSAVTLLERTDFVQVAPTGVVTRETPEREPLETAVLGVTHVFEVDRTPSELTLAWRSFPAAGMVVPTVWSDPTASERVLLSENEPVLRWSNDLSGFDARPVTAVAVEPVRWPMVSVLLFAMAVVFAGLSRRRRPLRRLVWPLVAIAFVLYPFVRPSLATSGFAALTPSRPDTSTALEALLANIYRSFELREESAIYDRLAVSVTGDQLTEVYLENRRALELENRGGARARVDEVDVTEVSSVQRDEAGGVRVEARWTVSGSVNHFGHVHYRQNRYDAVVYLVGEDGVWKIRRIEIRDERRLL